MYSKSAFSLVPITGIPKIFNFADRSHLCFLSIYFEKKFSFDKRNYVVQGSFCTFPAFTENHTVGRPKEPPLESPSEPYVSLSTHTAPSPTDGNIPNFQCANKFLSLLAIAPSQCSALLLVFFFL